jgi:hypothetical protein
VTEEELEQDEIFGHGYHLERQGMERQLCLNVGCEGMVSSEILVVVAAMEALEAPRASFLLEQFH